MWVLPVPLLPSAMMFSRATTYSQRASSRTSDLFNVGMAVKSKVSRALRRGTVSIGAQKGPSIGVQKGPPGSVLCR